MKNKDKLKGFFSGIIFSAIIGAFALGVTVFAAPIESKLSVVYDNIKIYIDGTLFQPKDSNGNDIKPFISKGITYLPVSALSKALGKDVSWDGKTKSIYIGKQPASKAKEVTVSNVNELFDALGSNKHIKLKPGTYNISDLNQDYIKSKNIYWESVYDGNELILDEISNLTLEGLGDSPVELVVEPRYANVLTFKNSNKIAIKNIKAGHTIEKGSCVGGVFKFNLSKDIDISDSILYGCGTYGIIAEDTEHLKFSNSIIEECTYGAMTLNYCKDFAFDNSKIRKCENYELIEIYSSTSIVYNKCEISDNTSSDILSVSLSNNVKFTNCKFKNNSPFNPTLFPAVDFTGTTFE
ncbi:right-handed parallel beta-helix repeat-containing protein [Ruminiclostridium josui]|uniref:right-handed parallel beta-helix repeat-containing protein n=1 Tax=Ruminiclostridium josui TaxID=1499 RepID=UPI000464863E|nr:right-handed parallel beta-helix repeat-containing protein [Ruminiclostridium josui]